MHLQRDTWAFFFLLVLVAACSCRGDEGKPGVEILSPPDQHSILLGETLQVESRARDDDGVSKIELRINNLLVHTADAPAGEKSFIATQSWLPPDAGIYNVSVIAYDSKGQASEPAAVTVTVEPAPMPSASPSPSVTPTPAEPTPPPDNLGPGGCTYDATFVTDVTIPDNTKMTPGTEFVKTWRLRNSGTCDWGTGFQFVFIGGEQMSGPATVNVPPTPAGSTIDVSASFKAPQKPGTYRGRWRMRTPDGRDFGSRPFVQIVVPPPVTPTPPATPTATAAPKPDLNITLVSGSLELLIGQPLALRVTVHNYGPGATERPALVRAVLRAGLEIESSVATLPAGGQEVASLSYTFDAPAALEVFISVDPEDEITEEDESNNTERVPLVINPPLYVTRTITTTQGLSFDLDDGADAAEGLDFEWQVVEGTVYVTALNSAGAARLSGETENISYALVAGLAWQDRLALDDLAEGSLFGFRTNDGRLGYAHVSTVLDGARTSARLTCLVWDWP